LFPTCTGAATILLAAGCSMKVNENTGLFLPHAQQLPAFRAESGQAALPEDAPSLTNGIDRSHFKAIVVEIPQAAVGVHPNYTSTPLNGRADATDFPTPDDALAQGNGPGEALGEIPLDFGYLVFDAVALPLRLFMSPPWSVQEAPTASFQLLGTRTTAP